MIGLVLLFLTVGYFLGGWLADKRPYPHIFYSLVAVVYGRYNFNPGPIPVIGERNSGHCVTVMHARTDGALEELWVRLLPHAPGVPRSALGARRLRSNLR